MLDRFPCEILYHLFDYFFAHELFKSFLDVSKYINASLLTYSPFRLNDNVNFVCQYIQPRQVISLALSAILCTDISIEQFTRLRSLKLDKCSTKQFKMIVQYFSQLKSLNVCLNEHLPNVKHLSLSNALIRLTIEIKKNRTSINEIECFLLKLSQLKYFVLKLKGSEEFINGDRWQRLTKSLLTFNFKFTQINLSVNHILDSFRTFYWLEEKQWFVAYQNHCLFTIPYFAPDQINLSKFSPIRSTAFDHTYLYDYVRKIIIKSPSIQYKHYFSHIQSLELRRLTSLEILTSTMNLNQIKHLSLRSLNDLIQYSPLDRIMRQLDDLSIQNQLTIDMINEMKSYQFKQILKLHIRVNDKDKDYFTEQLYRIFPSLQSVQYQSNIDSKRTMVHRSPWRKYYNQYKFHFYYLLNAFIIIFFLIFSVNKADIRDNTSYITKAFVYTILLTMYCKLVDIFQKRRFFALFLKEL